VGALQLNEKRFSGSPLRGWKPENHRFRFRKPLKTAENRKPLSTDRHRLATGSDNRPRCALCNERERTGVGAWWHDRRWWRDLRYLVRREDRSWEHPYHRLMLRAHFPWTCGLAIEENGYWYVTPEVGIC